jgi:hypothetical protein
MAEAVVDFPAASAGTKKTAKLTQIEKQADSGRRLVEYFLVVTSKEIKTFTMSTEDVNDNNKSSKKNGDNATSGSGSAESQDESFTAWTTERSAYDEVDEFEDYKFKPTITARYPLMDHSDNPLHENVTFFCHPTGGIHLRTEQLMPKVRVSCAFRSACVCNAILTKRGAEKMRCVACSPCRVSNDHLLCFRFTTLWRREEQVGRYMVLV